MMTRCPCQGAQRAMPKVHMERRSSSGPESSSSDATRPEETRVVNLSSSRDALESRPRGKKHKGGRGAGEWRPMPGSSSGLTLGQS